MKVVTTFELCPDAQKILANAGIRVTRERDVDASVLWVRFDRVDDEVLRRYPSLELVVSATTGTDHIDIDACRRRGVWVKTLRGERHFLESVHATSEYTLHLILSLLRRSNPPRELHGKTVLIVGYGRVGNQLANLVAPFECHIICADNGDDLLSLLPKADIVTVHVDLNPSSVGLFGRQEFAAMKPGAYFVNTSRPEIVVESELREAASRLGGVAMDFPLDNVPGLVITSNHVAGSTVESRTKTEVWASTEICRLTMNQKDEIAKALAQTITPQLSATNYFAKLTLTHKRPLM